MRGPCELASAERPPLMTGASRRRRVAPATSAEPARMKVRRFEVFEVPGFVMSMLMNPPARSLGPRWEHALEGDVEGQGEIRLHVVVRLIATSGGDALERQRNGATRRRIHAHTDST